MLRFRTVLTVALSCCLLLGCLASPPVVLTVEPTTSLAVSTVQPALPTAEVIVPSTPLTECKSANSVPEPAYENPEVCPEDRVEDLLARMTLPEKIGQMTQVEKNSIRAQVTDKFIGSVLSGGSGYPAPNTPEAWLDMVNMFQERALQTRLAIPFIGSTQHRGLAHEAVRKSLVLLKNDNQALPLAKDAGLIIVAGPAANDIGIQSGGWTIEWQGQAGNITSGTTILEGIKSVAAGAMVEYDPTGKFEALVDQKNNQPLVADVGLAVVGEKPYAEGIGDREDLTLSTEDTRLIEQVRVRSRKLVVILISGRPMIITPQLAQADAFIAAWLPGTEGQGVADVLFGDYPFTGKLPYTWPRSMNQLPFDFARLPTAECSESPLFPLGYNLDTESSSKAEVFECSQ